MVNSINSNFGLGIQQLNKNLSGLNKTQSRITTGLKVNGPKDNSAIFAIAQNLLGQSAGAAAVKTTLYSAEAVVGTAIAGGQIVGDLLTEIKGKVVQANNPALDQVGRDAINAEVQQLVSQVNTVASSSAFGGTNLIENGASDFAVLNSEFDRLRDDFQQLRRLGDESSGNDLRPDGPTATIAAASVVAASAAARPIDHILMTLGEDWSALRELSKHTATAAPTTAQAFVESKVPAANARAAAQIIFFLSVLRSGDVTGWLGADMLRSLERSNQRGLVERLRDDFRQLRRLGDESSGNDWRLLLFPFAHGDRIEPIHMFVRGQRRDQADGDKDVRFVIDLKMSALGALQFDGLLHHQTFDLMVRSHADLSKTQRQDISQIFGAGLESISYRGQISFQTVKEFPVSPFNDLLGGRHTPGAVLA
jgi:hypothetical protein